jgi:hypothetical protein
MTMPFRLWFYLAKVGGGVLIATLFLSFLIPDKNVAEWVSFLVLCLLVPLCLIGAFMGILLALGKLRMACPFCGKSGPAGGNGRDGMYMVCESCGLIRSGGPLYLTIIREPIDED